MVSYTYMENRAKRLKRLLKIALVAGNSLADKYESLYRP
jgi:hypothetical protein